MAVRVPVAELIVYTETLFGEETYIEPLAT
jgi:hypothetical protein